MDQQLKSNLTSSKHWFRLLFMLFFAVCLQVAFIVMTVVVCVQFLFALISGEDNLQLRKFGDSLSQFIYQSFQFLTYNSEEKPFPFTDWPQSEVEEAQFEEVDEDNEAAWEDEANTDQYTNVPTEAPIDDVQMEAAQVVADATEIDDESSEVKSTANVVEEAELDAPTTQNEVDKRKAGSPAVETEK